MNNINRIMIALLLLALLYALYKYQQSCQNASINDKPENNTVEEIARTDVVLTDQNGQEVQETIQVTDSKEPLQIQRPPTKVRKRVQFAKKKDLIDDDSIDLDQISQMSLGSLNSNNTNLSMESRNSMYSDASDNMSQDSLFDNLSFGSVDSKESRASKDSFFFA